MAPGRISPPTELPLPNKTLQNGHGSSSPSTSRPTTSVSNGSAKRSQPQPSGSSSPPRSTLLSSVFAIPPPIKRLFDSFPRAILPENPLPLRSHPNPHDTRSSAHALLSWTTSADPRVASFNPSCLAWQAYLSARRIPFRPVPSSNHAAAGARLPLLVVNTLEADAGRNPWRKRDEKRGKESARDVKELGPADLARWAADAEDGWPRELEGVYEAYMSLLNNEIRRAWLYHMNMTANFRAVTVPAYINTQSQSFFIRTLSSLDLSRAVKAELAKYPSALDDRLAYADAERAFSALENLMRRRRAAESGGGRGLPTLLECTLFAYLFLLLEIPADKWADSRLPQTLRKFPGLVAEGEAFREEVLGGLERPKIYDQILKGL